MQRCLLTLDLLKRFYQTNNDLAVVGKADPALAKKLTAEPIDIPSTTARLQSEPLLVAAITRHGFTTHSFAVVEFTVLQTVMVLIATEGGASPADIAALHVAPANIALFKQHDKEIQALQAKPKP